MLFKKSIIFCFLSLVISFLSVKGIELDYYEKTVAEIARINSDVDRALKESWWDIRFFSVSSFFKSTQGADVYRIKNNIALLKDVIGKIDALIAKTELEIIQLQEKRKNEKILPEDDSMKLAYGVLFFPWLILAEALEGSSLLKRQRAVEKMSTSKKELEALTHELEALLTR